MEHALKVRDALVSFRETRLSGLRPPQEFFDVQRISRPADMNTATSRISYNTRYFSGNYLLIILALGVYAIISSKALLLSLIFLVGGFALINKFGADPIQMGEHTITQKHLYAGLFTIGIPMLFFASPFATLFWLIGASGALIVAHASLLEPGVESEYATVEGQV